MNLAALYLNSSRFFVGVIHRSSTKGLGLMVAPI